MKSDVNNHAHENPHRHTRVRGLSPAGGGLLPNLQAGQLFSYSSYTHSLELTGHTHTRAHSHAHTRAAGKKMCAGE